MSNRGVYQDGKRGFNGWDKKQENQMYEFMNKLSSKGVMFMLSNFTDHDGNQNASLIEWAKNNNYKVIYDSKITKRNRQDRREILVINY